MSDSILLQASELTKTEGEGEGKKCGQLQLETVLALKNPGNEGWGTSSVGRERRPNVKHQAGKHPSAVVWRRQVWYLLSSQPSLFASSRPARDRVDGS